MVKNRYVGSVLLGYRSDGRSSHKNAHLTGYWLAERGGVMTYDCVDQAIRRRGLEAGITDLHAHTFRYTFAHYSWDVLNDDELM